MSHGSGKYSKIRHIIRVRKMLKHWQRKAGNNNNTNNKGDAPSDVPAGHVAVLVGADLRRYIVRATYLNHPIFQNLLVQTEEEYGFDNVGPLTIPCDESFFEEIIRVVSRSDSFFNSARLSFSTFEDLHRRCHVGMKNKFESFSESRPLFHPAAAD